MIGQPVPVAPMRKDLARIRDMIPEGASVLDLGCGAGDLLASLRDVKGAKVQGVEINCDRVNACIEKGINVTHGDFRYELADYPTGNFDYVVLSQVLHEINEPDMGGFMREMLRVGRHVIASFINMAYFKFRWSFFWRGAFPVDCPYSWQDSAASIMTVKAFKAFCKGAGITIIDEVYLGGHGRPVPRFGANVSAQVALFVLGRGAPVNGA